MEAEAFAKNDTFSLISYSVASQSHSSKDPRMTYAAQGYFTI